MHLDELALRGTAVLFLLSLSTVMWWILIDPLLEAYLMGLPDGVATSEEVAVGARVVAVYTALSRAEWALSRVAKGEGALAGKFRHPAVAPHLRALQRQFPLIEVLMAG